ncbi:MAG TPA: lactate racemase domain-containing protein [Bryobacteraceae bacterium]|jgi:nickel-dependent lactate racemase
MKNGFLSEQQIRKIASEALAKLPVDGWRVLVLIPDGTRTMPMPLFFDLLERELGERVRDLDYLVALGTHTPMSDEQLSRHLGRRVVDGFAGVRRVFNHRWDDPSAFATLGTISSKEIAQISGGLLEREVPVRLNRLILDYDHILICGPVFPHEVVGFSGGAKYFFPGIAGPEIIHLTHWLGALITSFDIIGAKTTAVRDVIHRAVEFVDRPHSLLAPVVMKEGVAGLFCGPTLKTWAAAAELSSERHVTWVPKPFDRILAVMPEMYDDLWTGGKGMYKTEPAVADGGEVVIYAPHIREVSHVHGRMIEEIGYHCRDYFTAQWEKFRDYPGGILAHSTHVKGKGTYDAATGIETPRIQVTLATGISEERCRRINLGYRDPATVDPERWAKEGWFVAPQAGEMLYRVRP